MVTDNTRCGLITNTHNEGVDEYIHLLRVYLIDLQKQIRNIYSVSFLHPDILMNDLETLLMESRTNQ